MRLVCIVFLGRSILLYGYAFDILSLHMSLLFWCTRASWLIQICRVWFIFKQLLLNRFISQRVCTLVIHTLREILQIRFIPLDFLEVLNSYILSINVISFLFTWTGASAIITTIHRLTHGQSTFNSINGLARSLNFMQHVRVSQMVWSRQLVAWSISIRVFSLLHLVWIVRRLGFMEVLLDGVQLGLWS